MNPALDDAIARLGLALLHFVWQGALIGCIAAAGLALLRNARPQARYAFCAGALLLCVMLPLWLATAPAQHGTRALAMLMPAGSAMTAATQHTAPLSMSAAAFLPGLPTVVLLWSIGAGLMSLRLLMGLAYVQRLGAGAGAAVHPIDPAWQSKLAELARRMGLRRLPLLRVLDRLDGPITVGRWRPLILLPAALLANMPKELLEALLAHELAHVRRFDYIANFLQSVVEALLFYHPVVWWLSRRMRNEREQIADDLAAQALGEARTLALALSELARFQSSHPQLALAARGGSLMTRISRLVRPIRQPMGGKLLLPVAGIVTLAIAAQAAGFATPITPADPPAHRSSASPAAPAVPAKPAAKPIPATGTISFGDTWQPFAFAFVSGRDGSTTMSGNDKDMREIKARRGELQGDFLWVRQGKQRYVVTDPATLAEVRALWGPVHAFDADIDKLSQKIDEQSEVMERVAREIEAAHSAPSAEMDELQKKMAELQKQRDKAQASADKLSRKMAATRDEKKLEQLEKEYERLEQAIEPLDQSIDALSEQMDRIGEALEHAMEQAIGTQERDADKAMEELSRQIEALSQQQEVAEKVAEEKLRALIDDLVKRGLARGANS